MINKLYLGDAFGWETDDTAKVAICHLRESSLITKKCPAAQLVKSRSYSVLPHLVKIIGYFPVLNILAGGLAIYGAEGGNTNRPHNKLFWRLRGVAMILTGPLLIIIDAIKYAYDCRIAAKFSRENPKLIQQFNTSHTHSAAHWPGHPVMCGNRWS
jgi:hypothetical protein